MFNIVDISIILVLNDNSNVYHWYFMKFYQFECLFRVFQYDSLQHIYSILWNIHYSNESIMFDIVDISIILVLNDISYIYHWSFMKIYQFRSLFCLFGYDSLQDNIYVHYEIFIIQMKVSCLISLILQQSKI